MKQGDLYDKVAVAITDAEFRGDLAGCYAHLDRLVELIDGSTGLPFTFGAAFLATEAEADEYVRFALHCLLHTLHDPMAIVACDDAAIYFVLPKIPSSELGQILARFHAECIEAHGKSNTWKFGVVEGPRPYDTRSILSRALSQAHSGSTFERTSDMERPA